MCATQQFWTASDGQHWHETTTLPENFVRSGKSLYFWTGTHLATLATLSRQVSSSRLVSSTLGSVTNGTIVAVEPIPGGVAALVSSRAKGQNWDNTPRVMIVKGKTVTTETLPAISGRLLVQSLQVDWPKLTVTATDYVANPARGAAWTSGDGGATWSAG
jgi:hypothetical protein